MRDDLVMNEDEFETKFKPFIQLKILICINDSCKNIFALNEVEMSQLVGRRLSHYQLLMTRKLQVECPLCHTRQTVKSKDLIGDYLKTTTIKS